MLTSTTYARAGATVIRLSGILNSRTYQQARDAVTKVATDRAVAVIIDINALDVGDRESWAVFINARWSVQQWPGVPMVLVTGDPLVRQRLVDLSVVRNVPVYETLDDAIDVIGGGTCRYRYRAREQFGAHYSSVNSALIFVHEHLVAWSLRDRVPAVSTVMTVFAENALTYATDGFDVRLEGSDDEVVLAVSDSSPALAVRRERAPGRCPAGLDIVSALCRRWGNTPTSAGKTVWARIGPDESFATLTGLLSSGSGRVVEDQPERIPFAGPYH